MRITLVRHGETTGQSSIRYYGATDVTLSEVGEAQMHLVRTALCGEDFDSIYSSRLQRSRVAASLVAGVERRVTPVAGFDEVDFGRWEGWTREEIARRDPDNYREWQRHGPMFTYPGGESRQIFHRRVAAALVEVLRNRSAKNVLMVLHKGVIASILTELLRLTREERARLEIDLASIHLVTRRGQGWKAERLNYTDHLRSSEHADTATPAWPR